MGNFRVSKVVFVDIPLTNARFDEIDYGIALNERRLCNHKVALEGTSVVKPTINLRCYTDDYAEIHSLMLLVNTLGNLAMTRTVEGEEVTNYYENCKIASLRVKPRADFREWEYWIGFKIDTTFTENYSGNFSFTT